MKISFEVLEKNIRKDERKRIAHEILNVKLPKDFTDRGIAMKICSFCARDYSDMFRIEKNSYNGETHVFIVLFYRRFCISFKEK